MMIQRNQSKHTLALLQAIVPGLLGFFATQAAEDEGKENIDPEVTLQIPRAWLAEKAGPELAGFLDSSVDVFVLRPSDLAMALVSFSQVQAFLDRAETGAA